MSIEVARERAALGATLLEEHREGWRGQVDLGTLAMRHGDLCLLGQLYGEFDDGQMALGLSNTQAVEHGFITEADAFDGDPEDNEATYAELEEAWKELLETPAAQDAQPDPVG